MLRNRKPIDNNNNTTVTEVEKPLSDLRITDSAERKQRCILCWQETEHKECPSRQSGRTSHLWTADSEYRLGSFGDIDVHTLSSCSSMASTEPLSLEEIGDLANRPRCFEHGSARTKVEVTLPKAGVPELVVSFQLNNDIIEKCSKFTMQQVACININMSNKQNKQLLWGPPCLLSPDEITTKECFNSMNLKHFVNELMDLDCVNFSFVSYYSFVCKVEDLLLSK